MNFVNISSNILKQPIYNRKYKIIILRVFALLSFYLFVGISLMSSLTEAQEGTTKRDWLAAVRVHQDVFYSTSGKVESLGKVTRALHELRWALIHLDMEDKLDSQLKSLKEETRQLVDICEYNGNQCKEKLSLIKKLAPKWNDKRSNLRMYVSHCANMQKDICNKGSKLDYVKIMASGTMM